MTVTLRPPLRLILPLLAEGFVAKEIGLHVHLSTTAVHTHVAAMRDMFRARNIAHIVHQAHCLDMLDRPIRPGVPLTPERKLALINRWVTETDVVRLVAAERSAS